MTNQIKKLYKNVGLDNLWVERYDDSNGFEHENWYSSYKVMIKSMMEKNGWTLTEARNVAKKECHKELLPFTAEKQIELTRKLWEFRPNVYPNFDLLVNCSYGEMIATFVNNRWQDLTEEERKQIKEILE